MIYILDTDVFTFASFEDSPVFPVIRRRSLEVDQDDKIVTTIITYEEQMRGWLGYIARSQQLAHQISAYERLKANLLVFAKIEVLDFDRPAADAFEQLRKSKLKVGTNDLKIVAIALSRNATLVTRNGGDFARIPHLKLEDWTRD